MPYSISYRPFLDRLTSPLCDALIVAVGEAIPLDWRSSRDVGLFDMMSITKSIVSMVIGRLFFEGRLDDLDRPLATDFPDLEGTPKGTITLKQIMAHVSGLDASAAPETIFASGDVVAFALGTEIIAEPGAHFAYNNTATNLLSAIVAQAAGCALDKAALMLLFEPLGISDWGWRRDLAGTPLAMSGCLLAPEGLLRLGQLMATGGVWNGRRLLSKAWCEMSAVPILPTARDDLQRALREHGLLWWVLYPPDTQVEIDTELFEVWAQADPPLPRVVLENLKSLVGLECRPADLLAAVESALLQTAGNNAARARQLWAESTWRRGLPDARRNTACAVGLRAEGSGGQHLIIMPERSLVALQLVHPTTVPGNSTDLLALAATICATKGEGL